METRTSRILWGRFEAELGLLLAALLWGITFPLIRHAVTGMDPYLFVSLRFGVATLVGLPFFFLSARLRRQAEEVWRYGLILGLVTTIVFVSQTVGLQTISSPRSAFITGMYILFVPLLSPVFEKRWPSQIDWLGALIATLGLYCLMDTRGSSALSVGDFLTLVCAFFSAVQMHLVQKITRRLAGLHPFVVAFAQVAAIAFFSSLLVPSMGSYRLPTSFSIWAALLICGVVISLGTLFLQARYQKGTTPERAAIIFSLEPVFATLFGYLILGETLTARGLLGGSLIISALLVTEVGPRARQWFGSFY